jgi:hypothetical protein
MRRTSRKWDVTPAEREYYRAAIERRRGQGRLVASRIHDELCASGAVPPRRRSLIVRLIAGLIREAGK